ncbi:TadE/TadG family type IV pilus assembly protein [Methylorubrum salsuginis]|uniref:TadE-like protein n=1 Tax=Methylorubrum salsuginis TaxID=414703 RepID=A0A1I4JA88_9HYPH|nr:TadE/TadG family type IV pilus assembly protein [Methylorubrum salsuginis]SFL63508.1 TadE-like protein [Methylorubrum salsuginis]
MGEQHTIASAARARTGIATRLSGLRRDERGIAVVEFSLVALPLFALIAVIMEASLLVYAQHRLDVAVERGTRFLRIGVIQGGSTSEGPSKQLLSAMCGGGFNMFRCEDVKIDLVSTPSFSPSQIAAPYDSENHKWAAGFGTRFDCPNGSSVVSLRAAVAVLRPFYFLDFTGQSMPERRQLLTSTMIFRTEGFEGRAC